MAKRQRVQGGVINEKTGMEWTMPELEKVCDLYIQLKGVGIHEDNPKIHELATKLSRTVRSVENQLLGFRKVATSETGRKNYNRLIPLIWKKKTEKAKAKPKGNNEFQFRISSALKDIIGQDLITDDYIAVFELVKNAFDAYATRVDIYFENMNSSNAKIIIKDNGKGMDADDLKNKWLFVAYSAKKEGKEDESFDYRDSIYKKRAFAGAKGIGRFSCDRLGRMLYLETTKKELKAKTEVLITDWGKFEEDSEEEFANIGIEHSQKRSSSFGLVHGTALEITELRDDWDRTKILALKSSLAKLINPSRGKGEQRFQIFIHAVEEKKEDKTIPEEKDKVNGEVKNFIFEQLGLKTTKISASVSEDGKHITTEVKDGGRLIYRIIELNSFELLENIDITLFYLNQTAKKTFSSLMGVPSADYGHVFLYKNGFRVYPYGEKGEDPLKIDVRKAQGVRRYFGTRELIGQIEIFSETDQLKETSSRGDGLRKTETYSQLEEYFWETLKKLERYVVQVQKWGLSIESDEDVTMRGRITKLIAGLSNSKAIIEFEYPDDLLEILESSQAKSAGKVIKNLRRIALDSNDSTLLKEIDAAEKALLKIQKEKEEAEVEAEGERKKAIQVQNELNQKESENLFLKSIKSQELDDIVSFLHHVGISSKIIDDDVMITIKRLQKGVEFSSKDFMYLLEKISFENKKVLSIAKFASKANFQLYTSEIETDIISYIREYINNVLGLVADQKPIIHFTYPDNYSFVKVFKPIELNIIIDNLLSNSRRAKSSDIFMRLLGNDDEMTISFADNGKGIPKENQKRIFDFGFTTTTGSGIGLFHVKKILSAIDGDISLNIKNKDLTEFIITIKK